MNYQGFQSNLRPPRYGFPVPYRQYLFGSRHRSHLHTTGHTLHYIHFVHSSQNLFPEVMNLLIKEIYQNHGQFGFPKTVSFQSRPPVARDHPDTQSSLLMIILNIK